jgi:hypothetical protein
LQSFAVTNGFLFNRSPKKYEKVNIKHRKMKKLEKISSSKFSSMSNLELSNIAGGGEYICAATGARTIDTMPTATPNGNSVDPLTLEEIRLIDCMTAVAVDPK